MTHELPTSQLGITEHTTDGLTVRFSPSIFEQGWDSFSVFKNSSSAMEARNHAAGILTRPFLSETLAGLGNGATDLTECNVQLIQHGALNGVYLVETADTKFVLVLSRGTPELNSMTSEDFHALKATHTLMKAVGISPFVPEVFAHGEHEGVTGFSAEYLKNHLELAAAPVESVDGNGNMTITPEFFMNDKRLAASNFNYSMRHLSQGDTNEELDSYNRINKTIKEEIITKLTLFFLLTRAAPAAFSVSSGDFMADPSQPDYDLQLITIRGGLLDLTDETFVPWLLSRTMQYPSDPTIDKPVIRFPLLVDDYGLIERGIQKAHSALKDASRLLNATKFE